LALSTKHGVKGIEYGGIIETPFYKQQKNKADRLKRQAEKFDALLEAERELWWTVPSPPLLITLHEDSGKVPGGILLQMDHDVSISAIHKRKAVPTGDFNAVPDAVLENVEHAYLDGANE
jgi:hypothetical protein